MRGTDQLELQVYLRPFAPAEVQHRQREIVDRVERLAATGGYEAAVVWWSPKVSRPDVAGPYSDSVPPVVEELFALAARDGFSLAPFVGSRHEPGPDGGDVVVLPMASLVVRVDGEIRGLYPVRLDGETYSIEDGLRALETGESVTNVAAFEERRGDAGGPGADGETTSEAGPETSEAEEGTAADREG